MTETQARTRKGKGRMRVYKLLEMSNLLLGCNKLILLKVSHQSYLRVRVELKYLEKIYFKRKCEFRFKSKFKTHKLSSYLDKFKSL